MRGTDKLCAADGPSAVPHPLPSSKSRKKAIKNRLEAEMRFCIFPAKRTLCARLLPAVIKSKCVAAIINGTIAASACPTVKAAVATTPSIDTNKPKPIMPRQAVPDCAASFLAVRRRPPLSSDAGFFAVSARSPSSKKIKPATLEMSKLIKERRALVIQKATEQAAKTIATIESRWRSFGRFCAPSDIPTKKASTETSAAVIRIGKFIRILCAPTLPHVIFAVLLRFFLNMAKKLAKNR